MSRTLHYKVPKKISATTIADVAAFHPNNSFEVEDFVAEDVVVMEDVVPTEEDIVAGEVMPMALELLGPVNLALVVAGVLGVVFDSSLHISRVVVGRENIEVRIQTAHLRATTVQNFAKIRTSFVCAQIGHGCRYSLA